MKNKLLSILVGLLFLVTIMPLTLVIFTIIIVVGSLILYFIFYIIYTFKIACLIILILIILAIFCYGAGRDLIKDWRIKETAEVVPLTKKYFPKFYSYILRNTEYE